MAALIDELRAGEDKNIPLPKGVAVGLLVGITDTLQAISFAAQSAKSKRAKSALHMCCYHLIGPRDRLIREINRERQEEQT